MLGSSQNFFSGFYTYKSPVSRAVINFLRKNQYMTRPTNIGSKAKLVTQTGHVNNVKSHVTGVTSYMIGR